MEYPRLDSDDYDSPGRPKRKAVVDMLTSIACDAWRYYQGSSLTRSQVDDLRDALTKNLPDEAQKV